MFEKINIRMLGGFSVTADGKILADNDTKITKPWQLFCYLVLHKDCVTPSEVLLQEIWGNEELTDPQNVLKNTIYALRRELSGHVKPGETPILYRAGGYCLNGRIKWRVDVDRFLEHCDAAERCRGGIEARTAAWKKAETVFRGELLPKLSGEMWVMCAERKLVKKYLACVDQLCTGLFEAQDYKEALKVSSRAMGIARLDEQTALWTFRALDKLHLRSEIVMVYNKTARYFEGEKRRPLCEEIRAIYRDAAKTIDKTEQDFAAIREELAETLSHDKGSESGAFYCNYEVFKRMYGMTARSVRGKKQVLMLITALCEADGSAPSETELHETMDDLRLAISATLRKSDIFAKYNKNQYAVLLLMPEDSEPENIQRRLQSAYQSSRTHQDVRIEIRTSVLA